MSGYELLVDNWLESEKEYIKSDIANNCGNIEDLASDLSYITNLSAEKKREIINTLELELGARIDDIIHYCLWTC